MVERSLHASERRPLALVIRERDPFFDESRECCRLTWNDGRLLLTGNEWTCSSIARAFPTYKTVSTYIEAESLMLDVLLALKTQATMDVSLE